MALLVQRNQASLYLEAARATAIARATAEVEEQATHADELERAITEANEQAQVRAACAAPDGFRAFLPHWRFINRESGGLMSFADLWPGQELFVDAMELYRWIFALKAGKLGYTEIECAYDAWRALFGPPNSYIGLFSKDLKAARELLSFVKRGIRRLPEWLRYPVAEGPGSETTESLILYAGPDDQRTIVSFAAKGTTAIDRSLMHAHVDELSNMLDPRAVWGSVSTIIVPEGTCHIVTRGRGPDTYSPELWATCRNVGGSAEMHAFFSPYTMRPRPANWRDAQSDVMANSQALSWYAPESVDDAFAADDATSFVDLQQWDACREDLPPLVPGDRTPLVLGIDAAVTNDCFAVVAVSRHPARHLDPAVRAYRVWRPQDFPSGKIDFVEVEQWVLTICGGGCAAGHPRAAPEPTCPRCQAQDFSIPKHNVVQIAYDPYQLAEFAQRLERARLTWVFPFNQIGPRLSADTSLRKLITGGRLAHGGGTEIREHVGNAAAKVSATEDSKLRVVKRRPEGKIDLVVALSMAVDRCLYLSL